MQKLKVAAVAMNGLLGQTQENLDAIDQWTNQAKDSGAELILFPELVIHGHNDPRTWYNAELVPDGPSFLKFCREMCLRVLTYWSRSRNVLF